MSESEVLLQCGRNLVKNNGLAAIGFIKMHTGAILRVRFFNQLHFQAWFFAASA